jgi:hypothetical protein
MFYPVIWICGDCYWDWHLDMRLQRVFGRGQLLSGGREVLFFPVDMNIEGLLVGQDTWSRCMWLW